MAVASSVAGRAGAARAPRAAGCRRPCSPARTIADRERARRGAGRLARASAARAWSCSPATWSCSASAFLERFPGAVINVHPSLLPAFPGLRAIEQALAYGVKVFGVTVHFVDAGVDSGPVILQRAVELPRRARRRRGAARRCARSSTRCCREAVRLFARGALDADPAEPAPADRRSSGGRAAEG